MLNITIYFGRAARRERLNLKCLQEPIRSCSFYKDWSNPERSVFVHYLCFNSFTQIIGVHLNSIGPCQTLRLNKLSWKNVYIILGIKTTDEGISLEFVKSSLCSLQVCYTVCHFYLEQSLISLYLTNAFHSISQILISFRREDKVFNFYMQTKKQDPHLLKGYVRSCMVSVGFPSMVSALTYLVQWLIGHW